MNNERHGVNTIKNYWKEQLNMSYFKVCYIYEYTVYIPILSVGKEVPPQPYPPPAKKKKKKSFNTAANQARWWMGNLIE